MAQAQPEWEIHAEGEALVKALILAQPRHLGHIDANKVGCAITTKAKPEGQSWDAQIQSVREPLSRWCEKAYCIVYYQSTWDSYTPAQREAMLFRLLERIHEDCNGKILSFSLTDSYALVKQFGTDYMTSPNLLSILEQPLPLGASAEMSNSDE